MSADGLRDIEMEAWRGFLLAHDRIWCAVEAGLAPLSVSMAGRVTGHGRTAAGRHLLAHRVVGRQRVAVPCR